jgi:hypothetical protein
MITYGGTNGSVSDGFGSHYAASGGGGVGDFANGSDVAGPGAGSHYRLCSCQAKCCVGSSGI